MTNVKGICSTGSIGEKLKKTGFLLVSVDAYHTDYPFKNINDTFITALVQSTTDGFVFSLSVHGGGGGGRLPRSLIPGPLLGGGGTPVTGQLSLLERMGPQSRPRQKYPPQTEPGHGQNMQQALLLLRSCVGLILNQILYIQVFLVVFYII